MNMYPFWIYLHLFYSVNALSGEKGENLLQTSISFRPPAQDPAFNIAALSSEMRSPGLYIFHSSEICTG